jgi:protein KRI1
LKDYILDKKWLTSKHKANPNEEQEVIDEEDEKRSQEMDQYEAEYNFRFEEPGGTTITQYPRQVKNSLRQKP